ncbi:3-oxoadipate enol-lactonase 2 [Pandoraea horticolens]|uniref:3-oxoadipate enol-lactonase 2 n=1 Tax=Pandoraea horticolens TaxID=2508298 RepID=A0A5E4W2T8_9BURK|nr:alpha/beta hydrolase [Pandoraea horticolens]VVE17894.1 3-oxoadipate enol-lactonase 2 [Pandoraea horticolens]
MATAQINDAEIYYEIHGKGPAIVLIAGYTCDHTFWQGMVPNLARHFKVITFDNRGIGRTKDAGQSFSIEDLAADTAALIKHLGLQQPAVIGQSMGGAIVQSLLAKFPKVGDRCVILNSSQKFDTIAFKALESLLALRKANVDFDLLIDATLPWLSGNDWLAKPQNIADFKQALRINPFPQSVADQKRQLDALKLFDAKMINKPWKGSALVISASEDRIASLEEGKALAQCLDARFVKIPGGHASPVEQAEKVAQAITEFLLQ